MRMPLAPQRASILGLVAVTSFPQSPIIRLGGRGRPSRQFARSDQITAQHQRGRGAVAALAVITRAPADLAEPGAAGKLSRRPPADAVGASRQRARAPAAPWPPRRTEFPPRRRPAATR